MSLDPATLAATLNQAFGAAAGAGDPTGQLLTALASTIQQQATQAATLLSQVASLEARMQAGQTATQAKTQQLVDTKTLGRVEKFKGAREDWPDWSFSFRAFLGGVDSRSVEALHWAAAQSDQITSTVIDLETEAELLHRLDSQIFTALSL